jgi:hypothetical protein
MQKIHGWLETCCLSDLIHETPWTDFHSADRAIVSGGPAPRSRVPGGSLAAADG